MQCKSWLEHPQIYDQSQVQSSDLCRTSCQPAAFHTEGRTMSVSTLWHCTHEAWKVVSTISRFGRDSPCTSFQTSKFAHFGLSYVLYTLCDIWNLLSTVWVVYRAIVRCCMTQLDGQKPMNAKNQARQTRHISQLTTRSLSTAIGLRKHRIPSDLRS